MSTYNFSLSILLIFLYIYNYKATLFCELFLSVQMLMFHSLYMWYYFNCHLYLGVILHSQYMVTLFWHLSLTAQMVTFHCHICMRWQYFDICHFLYTWYLAICVYKVTLFYSILQCPVSMVMIIFHYLYKLTLIAICHYQSIGTGYCEVALFCHLSLSEQMINVSPWISLSTDDNVSPCISLSTDDNVLLSLYWCFTLYK